MLQKIIYRKHFELNYMTILRLTISLKCFCHFVYQNLITMASLNVYLFESKLNLIRFLKFLFHHNLWKWTSSWDVHPGVFSMLWNDF